MHKFQTPGRHVDNFFFFCSGASICGSSVWKLIHVAPLAPGILKWLLDFWKFVRTVQQSSNFSPQVGHIIINDSNEGHTGLYICRKWVGTGLTRTPLFINKFYYCNHPGDRGPQMLSFWGLHIGQPCCTRWRWVCNFTIPSACLGGKGHRYPLDKRLIASQSGNDKCSQIFSLQPNRLAVSSNIKWVVGK